MNITEAEWRAMKEGMTADVVSEFGAVAKEAEEVALVGAIGWGATFFKWFWVLWAGLEIFEHSKRMISEALGWGAYSIARTYPAMAADTFKHMYEQLESVYPAALAITARIAHGAFGAAVDVEAMSAGAFGSNPVGDFEVIGAEIESLFNSFLDLGGVIRDFAARTTSDGSQLNLQRFLGAGLVLPVRAAAVETAIHLTHLPVFHPLAQLEQTFIHSLGLNRLAAAVLRERAQDLIVRGVKLDFNRQVKPNDYTEHQVHQAMLEGRVTKEVFDQVLDNIGLRSDIRNTLLDMQEPNLTEREVTDRYEHGLWHPDDVHNYFRGKGFRAARTLLKRDAVQLERQWHLEKLDVASQTRLFRDCVLSEADLRAFLQANSYSAAEENLVIKLALDERRQRRFLTNTQHKRAVIDKDMTLDDVRQDLLCQGYTPRDAEIVLKELVGEAALRPPHGTFQARPGSVHAGGEVVLSWHYMQVGTVDIDQGIGTVNRIGSRVLRVSADTTWTLHAKNDAGEDMREVTVLMIPPA